MQTCEITAEDTLEALNVTNENSTPDNSYPTVLKGKI